MVFEVDYSSRSVEEIWRGKNLSDTVISLPSSFQTVAAVSITDDEFILSDVRGCLRYYNIAKQKKPFYHLPLFEAFQFSNNYTGSAGGVSRPINRLEFVDGTLFCCDSYGFVIALGLVSPSASVEGKVGGETHLKNAKKLINMKFNLNGIMGTVRDLGVSGGRVFLVTAGRFGYWFDIASKGKKFNKMNLKQKLKCCLPFTPEATDPVNGDGDEEGGSGESVGSDSEESVDEIAAILAEAETDERPKKKQKMFRK